MTRNYFESPKDYLAEGPQSGDFKDLMRDIESAGDAVIADLPPQLAKWDHSVQDAAYLVALVIRYVDDMLTEIRFSRYGKMAVITNEDVIPKCFRETIERILQDHGFNYVSETELGKPFRLRERMNDDWFHRYFDYV